MKSDVFGLSTSVLLSFIYSHATHAFVVTPAHTINRSRSSISKKSSSSVSRTNPTSTSHSGSALYAKKKKGKKNKSKNKESGFAWATSFSLKPFESEILRDLASTACASFEGRTGKPLTEDLRASTDIPKTLWNAPVACVIVGDADADGMIQYANIAALETVGLQPDQFDQLLATKDPASGEWKLSESVHKSMDLPSSMNGDKAYESGYKKKIIRGGGADTGAGAVDICIENGQRWRLEKSALIDGKFVTETIGVAYAWNSWLEGEDTICSPGGIRETNINVDEIEEKIKSQGEIIRELKEVQGFTNKSPEVVDAVQELLRLKALLN